MVFPVIEAEVPCEVTLKSSGTLIIVIVAVVVVIVTTPAVVACHFHATCCNAVHLAARGAGILIVKTKSQLCEEIEPLLTVQTLMKCRTPVALRI